MASATTASGVRSFGVAYGIYNCDKWEAPVADNNSNEGRAQNRRVVLVVLA